LQYKKKEIVMARQHDLNKSARHRVAAEAARIMIEHGIHDFQQAKRKAADRLHISSKQALPSNREVESELRTYQALFNSDTHEATVKSLREIALRAMEFFHTFRPRLVGSVLNGTADVHAEVNLHLFAETVEDVTRFLMSHNIPFELNDKMVRYTQNERTPLPAINFVAEDTPIELVIFTEESNRQSPRSAVDGRPMRRANIKDVRALLDLDDTLNRDNDAI
jgi:hypothetical protein